MFEIFGLELSLGWYVVVFFVCSLINVILNTIKTIIMHKEKKISSTIINAITYGFYAIIVVMTASALDLWITILITVVANAIGVYGSMWLLESFKKDSLWEITATIDNDITKATYLNYHFEQDNIKYNATALLNDKGIVYHIYSENQKQSVIIKDRLNRVNAKYIVHEERVKL